MVQTQNQKACKERGMAGNTPCMSRLNGVCMTRIVQKETDEQTMDDETRELSHLSTDYTKG